ncbi:MAG: hypothetical protein ACRDKI_11625 [Solirubrobacterales bacterium]
MIRTPEARKRIIPKTENGYKLRAAMIAVVGGVICGIAMALFVFAFSALFHGFHRDSSDHDGFLGAIWIFFQCVTAFAHAASFVAGGVLLVVLRRSIVHRFRPRYEEFADDIGSWYVFGSMLSYVVCALPLFVLLLTYTF